jgi:hypothetical protein
MPNSDRLHNDGSRPASLAEQTTEARIDSFRSYAVAHPRLVGAKERLLAAIRGSERNTLIFVLGPTGNGKTTLRLGIERILIRDSLIELEADPGRTAVVGIEAVAPESGNFNWTFFFKLLLEAMEGPLADRNWNFQHTISAGINCGAGPRAPETQHPIFGTPSNRCSNADGQRRC